MSEMWQSLKFNKLTFGYCISETTKDWNRYTLTKKPEGKEENKISLLC